MKKNFAPYAIVGVAVVAVVLLLWKPWEPKIGNVPSPALVAFGQCLASKGATMYGAYWCSFCKNERKVLGDAFKEVKYVECTEETALCREKKITGYPTWILIDGTRLEGEQGIAGLARATGCAIPAVQ
ncbi:MAG: protein disulfide isomerase family protein [bacterium]|nr:protein disulfide isomerase family protein [bacterium]